MYICQIEIDNFKSFNGKSVVPFRKGFTTVSGPNGSGKSNIIDSILFCLGLSTSRTMRAEKLSDLINNLSKRRECVVNITFQKEEHELTEQDEQLLIEPAESDDEVDDKFKGEEYVQIARRIKETSAGYTSTYYLQGRPTTLTEIHEYLSQFHISPGSFNVMMQGDVQGFVSMSAVERRKIIDEIAGVAEFDRKIEAAQRELETTNANIERNTILLGEIEQRLEQLSGERAHALKYQKLREQKQGYENQLMAAKYMDIKKSIAATVDNLSAARKEKGLLEKAVEGLIEQIKETQEKLLTLNQEVKRKGEDQQIALKKQVESLMGHVHRKQDAIAFIEQQQDDGKKNIERMHGEIERQKEKIEEINGVIEGFEHQLKELQELFNEEAKTHKKLSNKLNSMSESSGQLSQQRSEMRQSLMTLEDEVSGLNREKLDLEAAKERLEYEKTVRTEHLSQQNEDFKNISEQVNTLETEIKEGDLEKEAYEAQLNQTQLDFSKKRVEFKTLQGKLDEMKRQHIQMETKKRALEESSLSRPLEMILASGIKGIHGSIAQLVQVEGEHALALEIALGGRIHCIVVDNDKVAQEAINYLRDNRGGRATFLPLNKIQSARSLPGLPKGDGVIDFAINLIDFDSKYRDVMSFALGDTLIVDTIEDARHLLRKHRMVTLDGSLLDRSGAMTGGSAPKRAGGAFANTQQLEQELVELATTIEASEVEQETLEKALTQLELKLEDLKEQYGTFKNEHSVKQGQLSSLKQQLAGLEKANTPDVDVSQYDDKLKEIESKVKSITETLSKKENTLNEQKESLAEIETQIPVDELDGIRKEMDDVKFQMDHFDAQIRNVKSDIQSKVLEREFQETGIKEYETRIEETKEQSKVHDKEKVEHKEEIELTLKQVKELEAQTLELDEELKKLQEERDTVQNQLLEEERNRHDKERELSQIEERILSFQARKRELEPQAKELEEELRAVDVDPDTINADELPSGEEVENNIQRLTKRMEAMEPVNMLAIKEYDDVNGRKEELSDKINTLNNEVEAIQVKIGGYGDLKKVTFMDAYNHVDSNFKVIFAELADGDAELRLTNPDSPFEGGMTIMARPRGKKMQRIEAMSGGEKSLTSLAFVFAIQRHMPAPFYALDEVDMNLDAINVEKLANMVHRESRQGAQFVVVSLRKPMLERSDRTIGVTQRKGGITKVTGVTLGDNGDIIDGAPNTLEDELANEPKRRAS